jgi:fibro-slime domain-containing protein
MSSSSGKKSRLSLHAMHALFGVFILIHACRPLALAQEAPSPLAGKTVHVYNPFGKSLPLINLSGTGHSMIDESGNWHRLAFDSLGGSLAPWMKEFGIRTGDWKWLIPAGVGTQEGVFGADVFGASKEIWIIVDPAGPATAAPLILTSAPRRVHIFNPWPVTGVEFVLNGAKRPMLSEKAHCGWNVAYILSNGPATGHFINSADTETWGKAGLGDKTPFDFTALFAAHGPDIWIGSTSIVSAAFPGEVGSCTYLMAATVHDMADTHPDYGGWGATTGMVQKDLGADKKPVPGAGTPATFNTWFNSNPAAPMPLKGAETCLDLQMGRSDDGLWEFDSNNGPSKEFFPLDDHNTLDKNTSCSSEVPPPASSVHNYGFCLESHATFVYKKGQVFEFRGDDDVWVFINNKLALDLGGIHPPTDGSINLDSLGLTEGQTYPWDFFFCERNKCGSSLRIKTTIYFKQLRALDHVEEKLPGGGSTYRVIKRIGGTGACGSSGETVTEVPPGPLTFVLFRVGGDSIQVLPKGASFGGITVTDGSVVVDTSKVTGLAPGPYRIVFYETANPTLRDEVQFTVSARNIVVFEAPLTQSALLGNPIRVIAGNHYQGGGKDTLVPGTAPWTATFSANVLVYADSSRSKRISSGEGLNTKPTGLDTLWVFGDVASLTDQTYTLTIPGSNKATVTFTLPPLDLPKAVSAGIYDDDGDGRGDRLTVLYDRDITGNLPVSVAWQWPASAAAVAGTDLASRLDEGKTLSFKGSPLSTEILTQGSGVFKSTYKARAKDSTQTLAITDRIAPVITEASAHLGTAADTLRLVFSEPLSATSRSAPPQDLFTYKLSGDGSVVSITPSQSSWSSDGLSVLLVFDSKIELKPTTGDFVRLNGGPGLAADALGNAPGSESRFRLITGKRRLGIQTLTFNRFSADPAALTGPVFATTLEGARSNVEDAVSRTGRWGVLMEADLADFAAGDGYNPPAPSTVKLEYDFSIFTNLGVRVASEKRSLACTDDVFKGDCRTNHGRLYVGWNYASKVHEKVATGAYVILFNYRIVSQGKVMADNGIRQVWGLLRLD